MHELFADWYRIADPNAARETIEKRWDATAELAASISTERAAALAAYIARSRKGAPEWFQKVYKTHDVVMPTRGIDQELRILAAVTLRMTPEQSSEDGVDVSVAAALSLLTGTFGMRDEPNWLREHLHAAAANLSETGRAVRQPAGPLSVPTSLTPESVNEALSSARTMLDAIAEANDYLWWTITKHSNLLHTAYDSLPSPIVALVAPADIFQFVRTVPVAPETETLLLHVLQDTLGAGQTALSFKNYISGLGREHAQRLARTVPSACADLCPIMWSISATAEAKPWQAEFEKIFGFRTTTTFPVQSVAVQLLRELCLTKIFAVAGP